MLKHKKFPSLFALLLAISVPVFIALFHYYSLSDADFLSSDLKYEAIDQIEISSALYDKLKASGPNGLNTAVFQDENVLEQIVTPSVLTPLVLTNFILRC